MELYNIKSQDGLHSIIFELQERGVQTRAIWGLIHQQRPYQMSEEFEVEKAEKFSQCIINLPCSTQITAEEIEYVAALVKEICGR